MSKGRILIVDDEKDIRFLVHEILSDEGYHVSEAPHSEAAYAHIEASGIPDLVILDIWLENSDRDGMEILGDLKKRAPDLPVLMISGHGNIEMAVNAIKLGAYDFIEKPFNTDRLLHLVERALESARLRKNGGSSKIRMVASSAEMQATMKLAARAAQGDARVVITGPAGAGRNHLAAWIHQESARETEPFVTISARNLEDSALLSAIGAAGEGSLVIRDVQALNPSAQKTLLKLVAGKPLCRVMVTADKPLKDIPDFPADLNDRLSVVTIDLPGLSGRRGDLGELASDFIAELLNKWGQGGAVTLSGDVVDVLRKRNWTGHVAELQALCTMAAFRMLQADTLEAKAEYFDTGEERAPSSAGDHPAHGWLGHDLRRAREAFERWYFDNLSERFEGNISQMAAFADMDRTALHRKLKSLKESGDGENLEIAS